eukprot:Blabericola_migrator_1__2252@NODE_1621_length_4150_cov_156_413911_g1056_i0_p4_GENE_NODE_1621_length_4150_cov_156_413911_g1056_i0NODE_1621_length_4150_cov_156_413911_g1056_i0_p4_ORF_typecomplete_len101_score6_69_NODE_1621_length_4150_cov_156_413911_g1056_i027273029
MRRQRSPFPTVSPDSCTRFINSKMFLHLVQSALANFAIAFSPLKLLLRNLDYLSMSTLDDFVLLQETTRRMLAIIIYNPIHSRHFNTACSHHALYFFFPR